MNVPRLPFVEHNGRAYLVVNFDFPPHDDLATLPDLLAGLFAHHDPANILLLRPLTEAETKLLRKYQRDLEVEAWARMVVNNEDRFRGRNIEE